MSERRRELFKLSKFNRSNDREKNQKENRIQQRRNNFDAQRNIGDERPFLTSTPYHKKITKNDTEQAQTKLSSKIDEKISRKEQYLQRFIEWKKEKQQQESNKTGKKPPFIPYGNPSKNQLYEANTNQRSFGMFNHKFNPTAGAVGEPTTELIKRQSFYVAVPTPPKKTPQKSNTCKPKIGFSLPARNIFAPKAFPAPIAAIKDAVETAESNKSAPAIKAAISLKTATITAKTSKTDSTVKSISRPNPISAIASVSKDAVSKGAIPKQQVKRILHKNAAAKAKALAQKNLPPTKEPERAKLSVNLKAKTKLANFPAHNNHLNKRKLNVPSSKFTNTITPLDMDKANEIFTFVTSTKMKSPKFVQTNGKTSEFQNISNTISPIETLPSNSNEQQTGPAGIKPSSAKRALLQPMNVAENRPRKHNFIRQRVLETTSVDSPEVNTLKPEINKVKIPTPTIPKKATPKFFRTSPRRSLLLKDKEPKKFNFVRRITLNETTEIQDETLTNKVADDIDAIQSPRNKETPMIKTQNEKLNLLPTNTQTPTQSTESTTEDHQIDITIKSQPIGEVDKDNNYVETPKRESNFMSSFVTCSRGKVSARKEREKRDSIYLTNTPSKDLDATLQAKVETPIEIRRTREAVLYFRKQLNDETQRLHALCEKWQTYKDENLVKLEQCGGNDMIDVANGQTKLLTSKKFMQFSGLIDRCQSHANGTAAADDGSEGTKVITATDLEGFWSMLGLQVENIEKRFDNLNRWKENDWQDPDAPILKQPLIKPVRVKTSAASKFKARSNAALVQRMREMRAALRSKETENLEEKPEQLVNCVSPRRLRLSTLTNTEAPTRRDSLQLNRPNTPDRICIIVPDRRSRSMMPTVISVPSPVGRVSSTLSPANKALKNEMTSNDRKKLLKQAVLRNEHDHRVSRRSLRKSGNGKTVTMGATDSSASNQLTLTSPNTPRTPSPVKFDQNGYKPILKTPGTARLKPCNVSFNVICSVKKFRKLGKHSEATEYEQVEEVHIDELKSKFNDDTKLDSSEETDDENTRTYRLRNRKVKLRPSSEFEIPQ